MPKISKQGPSWENDPPREAIPEQRDGEQASSDDVEATDTYDDKEAWPYADLQQESRNRWSEAPVNGVSRDELIERLRADDATKR